MWARLRASARAARTRSPQRVEHHCLRPWVRKRNLGHGSASQCASTALDLPPTTPYRR